MGKRGADDKSKLRKGEEGYWERSTEAAHAAAQKENSTFETVEELDRFYLGGVQYINKCLNEGWAEKDGIDWEPYEQLLPSQTQAESAE